MFCIMPALVREFPGIVPSWLRVRGSKPDVETLIVSGG